jgi:integrase
MNKENLIRKTWPKIRLVDVKGEKFYLVDGRRKGTNGKREFFPVKSKAETRAAEIAAEFSTNGADGLAMPAALRVMALECENRLASFGKTLVDATDHYLAFLKGERKREDSAIFKTLAPEWYESRTGDKNKVRRARTLADIRKHSEFLKREFGELRIRELTPEKWQGFLNGLTVSQRRKFNINSLTSQFFNWCIKEKRTTENPTLGRGEIEIPEREVPILPAAECKTLMETCETKHPDLTLNVALYLFAGLRPTEADLLKWENIHLEERQIMVLGETSKVKETRTVPIEDNLLAWFSAYKGERKGFVTDQKNLRKRQQALRVSLGYKLNGKNEEAAEWVEDILRHSYGSYWLAKYKDRAHLAENMGNSVQVIKKHYKRPVATSEVAKFWEILPKAKKKGRGKKAPPQSHLSPEREELEKLAA